MVDRIGSVTLLNSTLRDVAQTQSRLGTLQEQISSGFKSKTFDGLPGQVEQFTLLESKMRSAQQYTETNSVGIARLKTMDVALGNITDLADSLENLIVQARSSASGNMNFVQQVQNLLSSIANELNISFAGKYVFGGINTSQPPVPDAMVGPASPGVPDAGYYAGASENLSYRADERIEYSLPVRADDQAFQKIIAAAHLAIAGVNGGGDDSTLAQAVTLIQQGQEDLNAARAQVNSASVNLEQVNERLAALKLYWKGLVDTVGKTDLVAASTEVANHEAILQATFQVYARLSQLRLSDYL